MYGLLFWIFYSLSLVSSLVGARGMLNEAILDVNWINQIETQTRLGDEEQIVQDRRPEAQILYIQLQNTS